jgi:hypothetical protein
MSPEYNLSGKNQLVYLEECLERLEFDPSHANQSPKSKDKVDGLVQIYAESAEREKLPVSSEKYPFLHSALKYLRESKSTI